MSVPAQSTPLRWAQAKTEDGQATKQSHVLGAVESRRRPGRRITGRGRHRRRRAMASQGPPGMGPVMVLSESSVSLALFADLCVPHPPSAVDSDQLTSLIPSRFQNAEDARAAGAAWKYCSGEGCRRHYSKHAGTSLDAQGRLWAMTHNTHTEIALRCIQCSSLTSILSCMTSNIRCSWIRWVE